MRQMLVRLRCGDGPIPIERRQQPAGGPLRISRDAPSRIEAPISGAEKHEPDDAEDQDREPGGSHQKRKHRRPGFGLTGLGRGFDNLAMSLPCHGNLFD